MRKQLKPAILLINILALLSYCSGINASKLSSFKIVDQNYLMLWFYDGEVKFVDDGEGPGAFTNYGGPSKDNNVVVKYGDPLNLEAAVTALNYSISSPDDINYSSPGQNVISCYRRSKVNGMAEKGWMLSVPYNNFGDYDYKYTFEHVIFLELPSPLKQGNSYSLKIEEIINSDSLQIDFNFDIFSSKTEAIHVNLTGYSSQNTVKAADVYQWMGDGGSRDYSSFEGNKTYLYNLNTGIATEVGKLKYWMESGIESGNYNYIQGKVWHADFTGFIEEGTYRLAVEGIGCSEEFVISSDNYLDPYRVSVQGFFYMRAGEDSVGISPVPRRPLWIPGQDPANCRILITTMTPFHPEWGSFTSGDRWDQPDKWASYVKSAGSQKTIAIGGHVDALDWDRHMGHTAIIYDMLLPYLLTKGVVSDDETGIAESGNGIPDIIDEAANEVDFWLSLRDGKGYSHGLTNPNNSNVFYQAGTSNLAAWVNAANSAMLAESYRIGGFTDLMQVYLDSAVAAYEYGLSLGDAYMDRKLSIGEGMMRADDFKITAAAFLYNLTGERKYEEVIHELSRAKTSVSQINNRDNWNQLYATAAYLLTNRVVNYPDLYLNMKSSIIHEAFEMETKWSDLRATRRANANNSGYFQTVQFVHRSILAHAVSDEPLQKSKFMNALILEADWSLGRNPANMIQMTTASTPLDSIRSVENIYSSGRDDGTPGLHPGHTPYFNTFDWSCSMIMGCPGKLTKKNYPAGEALWPKALVYYNTRYVWAHAEFTPQQTMRGKMALYGYLYGYSELLRQDIQIQAENIQLGADTISFFPDNTAAVSILFTPANATEKDVLWTSGNIEVVTVSPNGKIRAVSPGDTWIKVSSLSADISDSCYVVVKSIKNPVSSVEFVKDTVQLKLGLSDQLKWIILPPDASDTSVIFSTLNEEIVTVDEKGLINALMLGEAKIVIETTNAKKSDTCLIRVVSVPDLVCHISFDKFTGMTAMDVTGNGHNAKALGGAKPGPGRIGNALYFDGENDHAVILHSDEFQWHSSNDFSISSWIFVENNMNFWTGLVTKSRDISPWSGLWISPNNKWHSAGAIHESNMAVEEGLWYHLVIVQDTKNQKQKMYVNGQQIETGNLVGETGEGDIWLGGAASTPEYFDGRMDELKIFNIALSAARITELYQSGLGEGANVVSLNLEKSSLSLEPGDDYLLNVEVIPLTALDQRVRFFSENPAVVSITNKGKIEAHSSGTTRVYASSVDGNFSDTCVVSVAFPAGSFNPAKKAISLYPNPAKSYIIVSNQRQQSKANFVIYNMSGNVIKQGELKKEREQIGVSELSSGLFLIRIYSEKYQEVLTFQVNR